MSCTISKQKVTLFYLFLGRTWKQYKLDDCIRNTTAECNPRQNSVRDKKFSPRQVHSQTKFKIKILSEGKIVRKKFCLGRCLGFPVRKVSCFGQIDAYHH